MREYEKKDSRIIVIDRKNEGTFAARNAGLEVAFRSRSKYITFVDADDFIEPDTYEVAYVIACRNDDDVLTFGVTKSTEAIKPQKTEGKNINFSINSIKIHKSTDLQKFPFFYEVWNRLYKKDMLQESNVKFPNMKYADDTAFNFLIRPFLKKVESIDKVFYHYRQNNQSITHTKRKDKDRATTFKMIPLVCNMWRNKNVVKGNEVYLLSYLLGQINYEITVLNNESDNTFKKYSKKILDSFCSDIYNEDTINKLSKKAKNILNKFKSFI